MTILIIDDNEKETIKLKENILEINNKIGEIQIAKNGIEGIKLIKKLNPDVIILDIIMPELDGIRSFRKNKSN